MEKHACTLGLPITSNAITSPDSSEMGAAAPGPCRDASSMLRAVSRELFA